MQGSGLQRQTHRILSVYLATQGGGGNEESKICVFIHLCTVFLQFIWIRFSGLVSKERKDEVFEIVHPISVDSRFFQPN